MYNYKTWEVQHLNYQKYFKIRNSIRYLLIVIMACIPLYIYNNTHLSKNKIISSINKFEITKTVKSKSTNNKTKHSEIYDPLGKN